MYNYITTDEGFLENANEYRPHFVPGSEGKLFLSFLGQGCHGDSTTGKRGF